MAEQLPTPDWDPEQGAFLHDYRPRNMEQPQYQRLAPALLGGIAQLDEPSRHVLKATLVAAFAYGVWLEASGYPLRDEVMWAPDVINQYVEAELAPNYPGATWGTRRSYLMRVARANRPDLHPQQPKEAARKKVRDPITATDLLQLRRLPDLLPTGQLQRGARALICCAAGAGMSHGDFRDFCGVDIHDVDARLVYLDVRGSRPRQVIAFADFTAELRQVRAEAGTSLVLGGISLDRKHLTHRVTARLRQVSEYNVDASTLRAHWLVRHMTQGTPLPSLMDAAGLKTTRTLNELMPFVERPSDEAEWMGGLR